MNKTLLIIAVLFIATNVLALRANRPPKLSFPVKEEEIKELNRFLESSWFVDNGRYELDVVTTPKTDARNGEVWIIWSSPTAKIQYKAQGIVWTISP